MTRTVFMLLALALSTPAGCASVLPLCRGVVIEKRIRAQEHPSGEQSPVFEVRLKGPRGRETWTPVSKRDFEALKETEHFHGCSKGG